MTESENQELENEIANSPEAGEESSASGDQDVERIELGANVEDEVTRLKSQLADAEKRVLMGQADMENLRKRSRREVEDRLKYAALPLMSELLEAVDNLERALSTVEEDENVNSGLVEGVGMVAQHIATVLGNYGCKKIESVGQPFDPNLHQAVQMQPSEEFEANTVMQELRTGFQLHDRVIRPSQVFVSTGKPEASGE